MSIPVFKSEVLQVKVHFGNERRRLISLHCLVCQTQKLSQLQGERELLVTTGEPRNPAPLLSQPDLREAVECRRSDVMVQEGALNSHSTLVSLKRSNREVLHLRLQQEMQYMYIPLNSSLDPV